MKAFTALFLAFECIAQTNATATFEVASVKASPPRTVPSGSVRWGCNGGPGTSAPNRFTCTATSVEALVIRAFDLKPYQLPTSNGSGTVVFTPPGVQSLPAGLDIAAALPEGATQEQFRMMLQNLLADRLRLTYHWDKKDTGAYKLVLAKNGPKFKEASNEPPAAVDEGRSALLARSVKGIGPNGCPVFGVHGGVAPTMFIGPRICVEAGEASMDQIVEFLTRFVAAPVMDSTGLKGKYSFGFAFARNMPTPSGWDDSRFTPSGVEFGSGATIFAALQDQLGLKLEKIKTSVSIFVIDHVDNVPTEN